MKPARFLSKMYHWRRMEQVGLEKPLFALTGDIDSTILTDKQLKTLENNLDIAKEYDVPYWIFITPDPPGSLSALLKMIMKLNKNVIIGSHGFKHVHFSNLGYEQQIAQLKKSQEAFGRAGVGLFATRTPYLSLNKHTYRAISDLNIRLDFSTSFGFVSSKLSMTLFPRTLGQTIFTPLTTPSDTFFRRRRISWKEMYKVWVKRARRIYVRRGVISFLVHPAGYRDSPKALDALLGYICGHNVSLLSEWLNCNK